MTWARASVLVAAVALTIGGSPGAAPPPDRMPPTAPTIDGDFPSRDLRPVFTFASRDRRTPSARLRFRCAFDGATMRPCARIHRPLADLSFGRHVLRARAVDLAGNVSRTTVRPFTIVGFWDAAADFQRAPRPGNPGADRYGNTVWFYLYSPNPEHDPAAYRLLPFFVAVDQGTEVWRNQADGLGGSQAGYSFGRITMHPGHPNLGQNAIVGWRSPVAATVLLQADVNANQVSCSVPANGVNWSVDRGATSLASGVLRPGDTASPRITARVGAGESLYLVLNDAGDSNCDGTLTRLTVETRLTG